VDIKTFYQGLAAGGSPLQGMTRLVEQIEASRYVSGVHGETSMHDLCLTQVASSAFPDGPHLRTSPRFDGTVEFRYIDTHVREKQWHRMVKEDDAFSRLVLFLISCIGLPASVQSGSDERSRTYAGGAASVRERLVFD
jgi:hypothetical protein